MPGLLSDSNNAIVPFSTQVQEPVIYHLSQTIKPPISRLSISFSRGNLLRITFLRQSSNKDDGVNVSESTGETGKVVEVRISSGSGEIDDAQKRRVAYGSVPSFALLQNRRNSMNIVSEMSVGRSQRLEWWQHVMEYSKQISSLLGSTDFSNPIIDDPSVVLKSSGKPTCLKAAWELLEIFYVDKQLQTWLPERLVDWLENYDILLSSSGTATVHSKLTNFQKELVKMQVIEDDPQYWEGMSLALAVGWADTVVKLLRLHSSYQLDQLGNRETENGLVEAVAVLILTMPHLRPELSSGKLGQCYKTKPDFVKAWEKWRVQVAKLECSVFWVQCDHHQTRDGLRNLLHIMLGNINNLTASTCHWMELFISHFLYIRPFTMGLEGMNDLALKCIVSKPMSGEHSLSGILLGILGENMEVVLAECSNSFGPWMVAHAIELLTAENSQTEMILQEKRYNLGGISIEELHRLIYAQVLSSHNLTWQIAPVYLASCPNQGLGLLEILLYRQPLQNLHMILKVLEICRLYDLDLISSSIMKIAGIFNWKHGRKGTGLFWLQRAGDEVRLNRIANQLFDFVGKSLDDDSFRQWEGLIELLGSDTRTPGGLEFLHKYRDFKKSLQLVEDGMSSEAARQTVDSLILLMKNTSTPKRFWLPLLHDSLSLLNWRDRPLLNVSETNLFLTKLQELSLARLQPDFDDSDVSPNDLSSVRLALATNLGRAFLED